jgi:hypothetical protein
MNEQILIQDLELLSVTNKPARLTGEELKKVLAYVKSLERCLADALSLAHGTTRDPLAS